MTMSAEKVRAKTPYPDYGDRNKILTDIYGAGRIERLEHRWSEVKRLGLVEHAAELEHFGYTVVPPEKVASPEFIQRMVDRVLELAEEESGVKPDLETGSTHAEAATLGPVSQNIQFAVTKGQVFEEAVINPTVLALVRLLLGEYAIVSFCRAFLKGPGNVPQQVHTDVQMPSPFAAIQYGCSFMWALSDFSEENGSTCIVPGSHHLYRNPDADAVQLSRAIECPAGSLIVFTGTTWHGARARTAPGLRLSLVCSYLRPGIQTIEELRRKITPEQLARNPKDFELVTGTYLHYGEEPPEDPEAAAKYREEHGRTITIPFIA